MTVEPTVEIYVNGAWSDISPDLRRSTPIEIDRGRSDEPSRAQPATVTFELKNEHENPILDGRYTPGNPESPHYPDWGRRTPVRITVPGGTPHLATDGTAANHASTPDAASLDVTGDIWVAAEVAVEPWIDYTGGFAQSIIGKWETAGNQGAYELVADGNAIYLYWTPDGTVANRRGHGAVMTPIAGDGRMAVAAHLDVNNGAGGYTLRFYVAETRNGPWSQIGATVTGPAITSIFASTAPLKVSGPNYQARPMRVYWAEVRSGNSTGTVVANPDFSAQTPGVTSFVDTAAVPKTWTMQGTAAVTDRTIRFHGAVDAIELHWPHPTPRDDPNPGVARATVTASVELRRMVQGHKPIDSTLKRGVTAPTRTANIIAYWPHEDGRDATRLGSPIPGVAPMTIRGAYQLASDSTLSSSAPLLHVANGDRIYQAAPIRPIPQVPGVNWEVTRFFRIDEPIANPDSTRLIAVDTNGLVATWRIGINDTGVFISGRDSDDAVIVSTNFPSDPRFFDTWAIIVLEVDDDGVNVDWAVSLIPIPLGAVFGTSGTFVGNTGIPTYYRNGITGPPSGVSLGHLIVSTGLNIGWLAGADTAWVGETAAHRFHRLCREEHIQHAIVGDPTVRDFFRGDPAVSEPMGPQRQLPLLDLMQECADTDAGRFYESRTGPAVVFRARHTMHNQDPAVTFDVRQRGMTQPFNPVLDDQRLVNHMEVTRVDGATAVATTDPEPGPSDLYDDAIEVNVKSDRQLPDQASWRLHQRSSDELRYPAWNAGLRQAGPGVARAWSEVEPGDKLRADGLPAQLQETVDGLLAGWRETLDFFGWGLSINSTPAGPWEVGIRDDDERGKRDTAGSELAASIDADDTSATVATTLGPLWTTDAAEFPFDLNIGGEQITVTAISGASSTQTFTIVRSVNGVSKSHAAGADVRLWRPTIRAI